MAELITNPVFWIVTGIVSFLVWGISTIVLIWLVASYSVYVSTLRKKNENSWTREVPPDVDPQQIPMHEIGDVWSKENIDKKTDVHIVNGGLNLYGEYYDFGKSRCAVILSGRTESLRYGYYFAIPYSKNDCNILVIDPRAHGLSEGRFNTAGYEESKDLIAWMKYVQERFGVKSFVLHGICIGSAGGMFALNSPDCPDCVEAIVTEGMFPNFGESILNHLKEYNAPTPFMIDLIDMWMKHYTGHSLKYGPIDIIADIKTPLLMLHSKEDLYSTPEYAQKLYDLSGSTHKKLVWFDHGKHSYIRINNTEKYDAAITDFLAELDAIKEKEQAKIS